MEGKAEEEVVGKCEGRYKGGGTSVEEVRDQAVLKRIQAYIDLPKRGK